MEGLIWKFYSLALSVRSPSINFLVLGSCFSNFRTWNILHISHQDSAMLSRGQSACWAQKKLLLLFSQQAQKKLKHTYQNLTYITLSIIKGVFCCRTSLGINFCIINYLSLYFKNTHLFTFFIIRLFIFFNKNII